MGYFPFFFELEGKLGIVVGGGRIALEKVGRLTAAKARLKLIAPEYLPGFEEYANLTVCKKKFEPEDLSDADYVVVATDDEETNAAVFKACRQRKIPVNVADDKEKCDFIFPSIIRRGDLVAGVSTSGASPHAAIWLRREFEKTVPDNIEEILDSLGSIRTRLQAELPEGSVRHRVLMDAADLAMNESRPITEEELKRLIEKAGEAGV